MSNIPDDIRKAARPWGVNTILDMYPSEVQTTTPSGLWVRAVAEEAGR